MEVKEQGKMIKTIFDVENSYEFQLEQQLENQQEDLSSQANLIIDDYTGNVNIDYLGLVCTL